MLTVRRLVVACWVMAAVVSGVVFESSASAAGARSQNFIIYAPNQALAKEIAQLAESYRANLAQEWLGRALPAWSEPCPIRVGQYHPPRDLSRVPEHQQIPACGATSFAFDGYGRPYKWDMEINGEHARLLDAVLPHEILHTIFATHFGRPLPRWADEGACTTVEHESERAKHDANLFYFLNNNYGLPFNSMVRMMDYPQGRDQEKRMLALYAQGYSVAKFLIARGGKQRYVAFIGEGMSKGNWPAATAKYYEFQDLGALQIAWVQEVHAEYVAFERRRRGLPAESGPVAVVADASADPRYGAMPGAAPRPTPRDQAGLTAPPQYEAAGYAGANQAGYGYGGGRYDVGPSGGLAPAPTAGGYGLPSQGPGASASRPEGRGSIATMSGTAPIGQIPENGYAYGPSAGAFARSDEGRLPVPPEFDASQPGGVAPSPGRGNTPADLVARGHSVTTVNSESGQGTSLSWYAKERDQYLARIDGQGHPAHPPMPLSEANRRMASAAGQGTGVRRHPVVVDPAELGSLNTSDEETLAVPPSIGEPISQLSVPPRVNDEASTVLHMTGGANWESDLPTGRACEHANERSRMPTMPSLVR